MTNLLHKPISDDDYILMNPRQEPLVPYVTQRLSGAGGPVVDVSDYMRAVQDQIAAYVPQPFTSLGTDGFGLSDTRAALRRHFKVDAQSIAIASLTQLAREGSVSWEVAHMSHEIYRLDVVNATTAQYA